jgi:hypothetical protein
VPGEGVPSPSLSGQCGGGVRPPGWPVRGGAKASRLRLSLSGQSVASGGPVRGEAPAYGRPFSGQWGEAVGVGGQWAIEARLPFGQSGPLPVVCGQWAKVRLPSGEPIGR